MKFKLILILLLCFECVFSQEIKKKTKNTTITKTEQTNTNCENLITQLSINDTDSLNHILKIWKTNSGEIEPILRLEALIAIHNQNFIDSLHETYITKYINKYIDRINASLDTNYQSIYENQKEYYDYIALRGKYDQWTKQIANNLISNTNQSKSSFELCLLLSDNLNGFNEAIQKDSSSNNLLKNIYLNEENENNTIVNLTAFSGIWIPSGSLANTFNVSPQFGAKILFPILKKYKFGIGINIRILNSISKISLSVEDVIKPANATYGLSFGALFSREFILNNKFSLDIIGGIGIGRIHTDLIITDVTQNSQKENQYYSIQAIDLSTGIDLKRVIFKKHFVGLNCTYSFTPYNNDSILTYQLGSQATSFSLFYMF